MPTRLNSILDLFVTNNPRLVSHQYLDLRYIRRSIRSQDIMVSMELHSNHVSRGANIGNGFRMLKFFKADYNKLRLKFKEVRLADLSDLCVPRVCTNKKNLIQVNLKYLMRFDGRRNF